MTRPTSKREIERPTTKFANGGDTRMLPEVPAEPAPAGRTGPSRAKAPGAISASGGPPLRGYSLSLPAVGGHTAPIRMGRGR
jgi:hypothetical protein